MAKGNVPIKTREIVERNVLRVGGEGADLGFGKYSTKTNGDIFLKQFSNLHCFPI